MLEGHKRIFVWVYRLWNWVSRLTLWLISIVSMLIFTDALLPWPVTSGGEDNMVHHVFQKSGEPKTHTNNGNFFCRKKVDTFRDVNVHYTLIYSPHKACLFSNKDIPMNKEGCFSHSWIVAEISFVSFSLRYIISARACMQVGFSL